MHLALDAMEKFIHAPSDFPQLARAAKGLQQTLEVLFERPIVDIRQLEAALNVPCYMFFQYRY